MSVSDPGIKAGDTIYEVTTAGLEAVGTATVDGTATITFSSDRRSLSPRRYCSPSRRSPSPHARARWQRPRASDERWFGNWRDHVYRREWHGERLCDLGSSLTATSAGTCLVTSTKAGDATHLSVSSPPTTITLAAKALPVTLMVRGHAVAGKTVILTISGSGFYGRPMVMARAGTTVGDARHCCVAYRPGDGEGRINQWCL